MGVEFSSPRAQELREALRRAGVKAKDVLIWDLGAGRACLRVLYPGKGNGASSRSYSPAAFARFLEGVEFALAQIAEESHLTLIREPAP